jgi:hypothetical protein
MAKTFGNSPIGGHREVNHVKMDLRKINCEARMCYGKVTGFDISAVETWRMLLRC